MLKYYYRKLSCWLNNHHYVEVPEESEFKYKYKFRCIYCNDQYTVLTHEYWRRFWQMGD